MSFTAECRPIMLDINHIEEHGTVVKQIIIE